MNIYSGESQIPWSLIFEVYFIFNGHFSFLRLRKYILLGYLLETSLQMAISPLLQVVCCRSWRLTLGVAGVSFGGSPLFIFDYLSIYDLATNHGDICRLDVTLVGIGFISERHAVERARVLDVDGIHRIGNG